MNLNALHNFFSISLKLTLKAKMSVFFGLLVLSIFHFFFVETRPHFLMQRHETKCSTKKIDNTEYIVKMCFDTFSRDETSSTSTQKPDIDNDTISLFCQDIEFECTSNHRCIPIESYCDGKNDCTDGSDELTCATSPAIHFLSIINDTTVTSSAATSIKALSIIFLYAFLYLLK